MYRYLCTHTLCIYMLSCSGVTGAVKEAIETLQESGATAFVLDIRNNSGGLFPAGIEIAKMWYAKRTSFTVNIL
jgi:C-terminal processing protease CtpA/Prc